MVFYCAVGVGPREAIEILQRQQNHPTSTTTAAQHGFKLSIDLHALLPITNHQQQQQQREQQREESYSQEQAGWLLDQLATALLQNHHIKELALFRAAFDGSLTETTTLSSSSANVVMAGAVRRLLGTALPGHPSLTCITFSHCRLAPEQVELLTSSLATNGTADDGTSNSTKLLKTLAFESTPMNHPNAVAALANNLLLVDNNANENNNLGVQLEKLVLYDCGIDSEACSVLLKALDGNEHLRCLELRGNHISHLSQKSVEALSRAKNLKVFGLSNNPLTDRSLRTLAYGLRTNVTLEHLRIYFHQNRDNNSKYSGSNKNSNSKNTTSASSGSSSLLFLLFHELLTTYNYTLRSVAMMDSQHRVIDALLKRNFTTRQMVQTQLPTFYQNQYYSSNRNRKPNMPKSILLFPQVLASMSSKPSLLYDCVRNGNLDLLLASRVRAIARGRGQAKGKQHSQQAHVPTAKAVKQPQQQQQPPAPKRPQQQQQHASVSCPSKRSNRVREVPRWLPLQRGNKKVSLLAVPSKEEEGTQSSPISSSSWWTSRGLLPTRKTQGRHGSRRHGHNTRNSTIRSSNNIDGYDNDDEAEHSSSSYAETLWWI